MDIKLGTVRSNENFFSAPIQETGSKGDADFHQHNFEEEQNKKKKRHAHPNRHDGLRINDYDSNIMESYAYKDLKDEILKYEYAINHLEAKIANLNTEINTLEGLNSDIQLSDLKFKRDLLETELAKLNKEYESISLSTGISAKFSRFLSNRKKKKALSILIAQIFTGIMSKISVKYKYSNMVKESLKSLNNINSGVNDLIKISSPYGESDLKYEKLTAFLNQANYLHAKILSNKK